MVMTLSDMKTEIEVGYIKSSGKHWYRQTDGEEGERWMETEINVKQSE